MDRLSADDRFSVTYRIAAADVERARQNARDIAFEQTVETPAECVPADHFERGIVGRVESLRGVEGAPDRYDAVVSYHVDVAGNSLPQFLNATFGNISLKTNIQVQDIDPGSCAPRLFPGPSRGIEGIRAMLGVYGRPLACTALKPMGVSSTDLARLASAFALGGVDIIKDDHGLADQPFHPFRERVARCQDAIAEANRVTGRKTLYCPMVSGRFDHIEQQVRYALSRGVEAILIAPMLAGLDVVRHVAATYRIAIVAHPAFTGTHFSGKQHGMTPAALLGTLFRMVGADISVFPNAGGRFSFTRQECADLAYALRRPLRGCAPAFPAPAGGMRLDRIQEMSATYGTDAVCVIGGALLGSRHDQRKAAQEFMRAIRACGDEQCVAPAVADAPTSCDMPGSAQEAADVDMLRCTDFCWSDRRREAYKRNGAADFRGITRQNLSGMYGEGVSFDLRYFEIAPGGYSSLERHEHQHVIIGARGEGKLIKGDKTIDIRPHDIGRVRPHEVHQLRNNATSPFGFFCIVDHFRDRPTPVTPAGGGGRAGEENASGQGKGEGAP